MEDNRQINNTDKIQQLQTIIDNSNNIVFFGGAGVSTESGIPDFRSTQGLYNQKWKYPPETIVSHSFFEQKTKDFYQFYTEKMICLNAKPNKAHLKLVELEQKGKLKAIITQNIDGLHQIAGSKVVYELHGSVHRNYCQKCHSFYDAKFIIDSVKNNASQIPTCTQKDCHGPVKPDVVLYEEGLDNSIVNASVLAIQNADTLIIGGTSLSVYPAAGLIQYFSGKNLVIINMSTTKYDTIASLLIEDKIGEVFSQITL